MHLKNEAQEEIVNQDWHVHEQIEKVRKTKESLDDLIDANPLKQKVDSLAKDLEIAKEELKLSLLGDADVNNTKEILAAQKSELKARKLILSTLLVHYIAEHKVQSIEVQSENHSINIAAKIGKRIREQMELPL